MEEQKQSTATLYNSVYEHGVDEKRRVQIPAKWRPSEPGVEFTVVLWPKSPDGPCLRVLPPGQLARLMGDLDAMAGSNPNKTVLKRFIGSSSVQVSLDKAGRICLPDTMTQAAGITNKAIFVGLLDRFEIWSPERHARVKAADAVLAQEAFKMME